MLILQVQILEERLNDQFVMRRALEKALCYKPCAIRSSNESCTPKVKILSDLVSLEETKKIVFTISL